jgi:molybdopterin-guanine dinucleotide biosynthesis protein A
MTSAASTIPHDALILAGGAARRLGGIDKPAHPLGGRTLLDRVLDAVGDAQRVVVVGPVRATEQPVRWTREEPPGSGPVPALAAGLALVRAPLVVVLAADLPFLSASAVRQLLVPMDNRMDTAMDNVSGAVALDDTGVYQWLLGCWRAEPLRAAVRDVLGSGAKASLRAVMTPLAPVALRVDAGTGPPPWYDCDTPAELSRAAAWTEGSR